MSSRPASAIRRSQGSSRSRVVSGPWPGRTRTAGRQVASQASEAGDHGVVVAAGQIGAAVGAGKQDVPAEQQPGPLLVEADGPLGVAGRVEHVEDEVANRQLLTLLQVTGRDARLHLEPVVVGRGEPMLVERMDGKRRPRSAHQRCVVEDVVDVPVRVGHQVQRQPVRRDPIEEWLGGAQAGVDDQGIGRAAVPDEVRVGLPRPERTDLEARMVIRDP